MANFSVRLLFFSYLSTLAPENANFDEKKQKKKGRSRKTSKKEVVVVGGWARTALNINENNLSPSGAY